MVEEILLEKFHGIPSEINLVFRIKKFMGNKEIM